jgi:hypothetical protein
MDAETYIGPLKKKGRPKTINVEANLLWVARKTQRCLFTTTCVWPLPYFERVLILIL